MAETMRTVTFKLTKELDHALDELARSRGASRSAVIREALESLAKGQRRSVTSLAADLVGSVEGHSDLATNRKHMSGYGK
ncbi:MAG TPA: CopG family transcriptional regulator [Acidobacteriota bacterium]|nr:CopG family transcriptional regulator [Acidobacteriota bacterium]